jgi:asparagine synthetase B (glutamine-hydrolysing)
LIVASCRAGRSDAAVGELRALGEQFNLGAGRLATSGAVTVMAWDDRGAWHDPTRLMAWTGRLDSSIASFATDDWGGFEGTYAVLAEHRGGLVAARSLFGGRPLYYGVSPTTGDVYVCSRFAPLVYLLGGDTSPDIDRLAAYAVLRPAADPRATALRSVQRVLPGETIRFEIDGASRSRRASFHPTPAPEMSTQDWADALRAEIEAAVARATSGCIRPAVYTSGGLDSSAVLAALVHPRGGAGPISPANVLALTHDFDSTGSDRPYFAALVESTSVEPVRIVPEASAHHALASMVLDGAPAVWPTTAMNMEILGRARAIGADCVLTGVGGDFLWDVEIDAIGERAVAGHILAAARDAIDLKAVFWMPTRKDRLQNLVVRPLLRSLVPARARAFRSRRALRTLDHPVWAGAALRAFLRGHVERRIDASERIHDRPSRMTDLALSTTLADVVDAGAQAETYVGAIESHVFLDVRLARFIASIPSNVTLAGGWLRGVLRMAFRDVWPRSIVERLDKAEFGPATAASNEGLRATGALNRLARMNALGDLGLVEPARFRAEFEAMLAGRGEAGDLTRAWPLLALEAFVSGIAPRDSASCSAWSAA